MDKDKKMKKADFLEREHEVMQMAGYAFNGPSILDFEELIVDYLNRTCKFTDK